MRTYTEYRASFTLAELSHRPDDNKLRMGRPAPYVPYIQVAKRLAVVDDINWDEWRECHVSELSVGDVFLRSEFKYEFFSVEFIVHRRKGSTGQVRAPHFELKCQNLTKDTLVTLQGDLNLDAWVMVPKKDTQ